jgi:carbonic anhydrase
MHTHTKNTQATITPERALGYLKEGNDRFVKNLKANRNLLEQVNETRDGQWPFATILSCIDSRTSSELIFDQGLGDVFSIRMAGNVLSDVVLGSMEFACKLAGSRLIVVLGHTSCGAIKGACDNVQLGNLTTLLNLIQPSVYFERTVSDNRSSSNAEFVDKVARIQVRRTVEGVIERSMVLREMVEKGEIGLIGALYDISTGATQFFDDTWMCGSVRHFYLDTTTLNGAGTVPLAAKAATAPSSAAARRQPDATRGSAATSSGQLA